MNKETLLRYLNSVINTLRENFSEEKLKKLIDKRSVIKSEQKVPATIWSNPLHFLAFGFGSGASPWAPGTMGTLVAIPIFLLLHDWSWWSYLIIVAAAVGGGVYICEETSRDIGVHDHPGIVWDEICGYLIAMFLVPATWLWILLGFILFRIFDILKPWPIDEIDKQIGGGLGIMADDVLAGFFTWLILQLILLIF